MEPLDLGLVIHGILERLYRRAADDPAVGQPEALAMLPDVVAERGRQAEREGLTGYSLAWKVKQRQILADLTRAVRDDPVWTGTLRPALLEWSFGTAEVPPVELAIDDLVVRFAGRVDRFDVSPDGQAAALIDYKTGKGDAEKRALKRHLDIQLRVYRLAAASLTPPPGEVTAAYRLVTRRGDFRELRLEEDGSEITEALRRVVGTALAGMRAGVFPRWRESDRRCAYCELEAACAGRVWVFERKKDDERLAPLRRLKEGTDAASG
jgi:RecB family exonuclease